MNRRLIIVWALCGGLALWSLSYETFRFDIKQFQLPDLQLYVNYSLATISSSISSSNSTVTVKREGYQEGYQQQFPVNMSYTSWLELYYPDRANITRVKSNTTNPLLEYFPDFCGDCMWGASKTCTERANYLVQQYRTQNAEQAVMKDRRVCINPPIQIFWKDNNDTKEEQKDNMFAYRPIPQWGNISTSPVSNISIYVYDTLGKDVGIELEVKMRAIYSLKNNTDANVWADIALIDLFRSFPGRTDNASMADLFVVPYASASHCHSKPTGVWYAQCKHIEHSQIKTGVFDNLAYIDKKKNRHLFLNVINYGNSNIHIKGQPLTLTIGPRGKITDIIVPYLNSLQTFQPSQILSRDIDWWTRPRTYAMTYFFGISNSNMRNSPRIWRQNFMAEVQSNWPAANDTLGGLPYAIRVMNRDKKPPSRLFTYMYEESIFCPCFPGDTPTQKRFYDVMLMGCIPVVLSFPTHINGQPDARSWHQPGGQWMENSLPWAKGSGSIDPKHEVDYRSFVVEIKDDVKNVRPTIEALMQNYTEIRRLQLNLKKYAPYFSYGMGTDSHKHPDAFSQIMESMKFYLAGLN